MKTLIVVLLSSITGVFAVQHVLPCWTLVRANRGAEDPHQTLRAIDEFRSRRPCLCPADAWEAFRGTLEHAVRERMTANPPDFRGASEYLQRYHEQIKAFVDMQSLTRELRDRHLAFVRNTSDFERAVAELENLRSLYADAETLAVVNREEPHVYFRHAEASASAGRHEDALTALRRVISLDATPPQLYEQARQLAVAVTEQSVRDSIAQNRFDGAFRMLQASLVNFPGSRMERLAASIDREVFGRPRDSRFLPLPVPVGHRGAGAAEVQATLIIQNQTEDAIRVAYRGPTVKDVTVAAGGSQTVALEPGAYLVAGFPVRGDKPAHFRGEYRVPPGSHSHTIVDVPQEGRRMM